MMVKKYLKFLIFAVSIVIASPLILAAWLEKSLTASTVIFGSFAQLLALIPGPVGQSLRAAYYYATLDACSWEVHIGFGSLFSHRGARISGKVSTGAYCVLGHVIIESGVRLASRVSIPSGKRQHLDQDGKLSDETQYDEVTIGAGAWIGEAATILADIGRESIVSAGAVVVRDMPAHSIVGGNPATVLKNLEEHDRMDAG